MTAQEAIERIKYRIETASLIAGKGVDGKAFEDLDMAIEALEKQIPKKPYIQQDERNNDCLECPNCDSFIGFAVDCKDEHYQIPYCPNCGQAIDWSEEE